MKFSIKALRLRTLTLSLAGWILGTSLAGNEIPLDIFVAILTLLTAFSLQILSNLANDYGDAISGIDANRIGEERMVNSGKISKKAMKKAIISCAVLALILGGWLLYQSFPDDYLSVLIFFSFGLAGIATAITYTIGKNPYGYAGYGDIAVFIFFGILLIFGTYYLQTQQLNWQLMLPASSLGLFSVGVLNINNIRDIESDRAAGKKSIPVRIGKKYALLYHIIILTGGMLTSIIYICLNYESWLNLLFLVTVIPLAKNIYAVSNEPSEKLLDLYLKQMTLSTLLFSLLFSLGQTFG